MKMADHLRLCPSPVTAAALTATFPLVTPPAPPCRGRELRISCHAALINGDVYGFLKGKPHALDRNREVRQENPEKAEGSAVQRTSRGNRFRPNGFARSHGSTFAWCR